MKSKYLGNQNIFKNSKYFYEIKIISGDAGDAGGEEAAPSEE